MVRAPIKSHHLIGGSGQIHIHAMTRETAGGDFNVTGISAVNSIKTSRCCRYQLAILDVGHRAGKEGLAIEAEAVRLVPRVQRGLIPTAHRRRGLVVPVIMHDTKPNESMLQTDSG